MKHHYIDGRWAPARREQSIPVIDPSDGKEFERISRGCDDDVHNAVLAARRAFEGAWGRMSAIDRGRVLYRIASTLSAHAEELSMLEARDCGKPLRQARADATAVARYFEFYAGACDKLHGETIPYQDGYSVLTWREPHGVTGHIIPWNYPMQIFGRSVGGALAAGNACVVKPSEDACLSILRIAELAMECGLPPGTLNVVTGFGHEAGDALIKHPGIDHVSFTGSPSIGKIVVRAAAGNHTPVTLELGGKSPQIVFADADLDAVVPVVVNAIVQNAGQTCSAGSRLLVQRPVYEELIGRLAGAFANLRVGTANMDLDCGPLIRQSQLERVRGFLEEASADGLSIAGQGKIVNDAPSSGFYQAPVLIRDVPPAHRLAQEEVFGPVLAATCFEDERDAVKIANGTAYGLVASVWSSEGARQFRMARQLRAGQVFINNYGAAGGVELPFGGMKASGYGREKGLEALYGFTTLKTVAVRHG